MANTPSELKEINDRAQLIFALENPTKNPKSLTYLKNLDSSIERLRVNLATVSTLSRRTTVKASAEIERVQDEYKLIVILGSLIIVLLGLGFGFLTIRGMTKKIKQLVATTHAIAAGKLDEKVVFSSHDELGELADAFNMMIDTLSISRIELQQLNEHLEQEVWRRTYELERLSITDSLTGLYNQRNFYKELEEEGTRALRQGRNLYLMLFDVDKFKQYNDEFGHIAGDKILVNIGNVTRESIRTGVDSAYRYGGDEFTIIIPEADEQQALEIGNRLIKKLNEQGIKVSIGLSSCICETPDIEDFLRQADEAMYSAKWAGGNRIVSYRDISDKKAV